MSLHPILALLHTVVLIIGLASKPTKFHPLFFSAALTIFLCILVIPYQGDDPGQRYRVGISSAVSLGAAFDYLVLTDSQESIRRIKDEKPASQLPYLSRLQWAVVLLHNLRDANWNSAVPNLRYPTYSSRQHFILSRFVQALVYFILADAVAFICRHNPALQYPPTESLNAHGFMWQVVNVLSYWMTLFGYMSIPHTFASAVAVAIGISEPEDWPTYFGHWSETTSIRAFWGKTWHQSFRRSIQPQSKYFAQRVLHLRRGLASRYVQLFACFFLSGLYHAAADWVLQRNPDYVFKTVKYFIREAAIITVEDFLIFLGNKVGIKSVPRVVSYAWVLIWMGVSGPLWIETIVKGGVLSYFAPPKSVSVIEKIFG